MASALESRGGCSPLSSEARTAGRVIADSLIIAPPHPIPLLQGNDVRVQARLCVAEVGDVRPRCCTVYPFQPYVRLTRPGIVLQPACGTEWAHHCLLQVIYSVSRGAPLLRESAIRAPEGMLSLLLGLAPAAVALH